MTLVLVGVVTAEGISKMLDPDAPIFDEMAAYLMPLVQRYGLAPPAESAAAAVEEAGD
jgi:hypothetical protein